MKRAGIDEFKPFISVLIVIVTLFSVVFLKMEARSQGYSVWQRARAYKKMRDIHRLKVIEYARLKSPSHLSRRLRGKMTRRDGELAQVIQISGEHVAVRQ